MRVIGSISVTRNGRSLTRQEILRLRMLNHLNDLDHYATQHNVIPAFSYTGDMEQLERLAPNAAGRFKLRREIDRMRRALADD